VDYTQLTFLNFLSGYFPILHSLQVLTNPHNCLLIQVKKNNIGDFSISCILLGGKSVTWPPIRSEKTKTI